MVSAVNIPYLDKWIPANKLSRNEHLRAPNGAAVTVVGGTVPKQHDGWMWDLTVPGNNDYDFYVTPTAVPSGGPYAGTSGTPVLVHNCGGWIDGHTADCRCAWGEEPTLENPAAGNFSDDEISSTAKSIARGHADAKHGSEFPGMSVDDLANHVEGVMKDPLDTKDLNAMRTAYLGRDGTTVVISDPLTADGGTAFNVPATQVDGYWEGLK